MYRNRRDSVKLGRVMEPSEQGGNCFKSITFMEISEFQKQGEDHYFWERGGRFAGSERTERVGMCTGVLSRGAV